MSILGIAARVASGLSQPLSERPDYGTRQMVSQEQEQDQEGLPHSNLGQERHEIVGEQEKEGVIRKTPGKGYCVKSEKNPDWSGGCFPTKGEAESRLKNVEMFKHMKKGAVEIGADELAMIVSSSGSMKVFLGDKQVDYLSRIGVWASASSDIPIILASFGDSLSSDEFAALPEEIREFITAQSQALCKIPFIHVSTPMDEAHDACSKTVSQERNVATNSLVTIKEFEWDPGDKRSYGSFRIVADTQYGELVGSGMISSNSDTQDEVWTLDGKPIPKTVGHPDLGIPHYYAGNRAMSRFEKLKDTEIPEILADWLSKVYSDT